MVNVVAGLWIIPPSLVHPLNVSQPTSMNGPQLTHNPLAPLAPPGDLVHSLAHSQPVVSDSSSLNDQPAQQFFDHDTVPLADLPPSQLLDSLPLYPPVAEPKFVWGTTDSVSFIHSLDGAYCVVRHWIRNSFMVPRSSAGRAFVSKLARLFRSVVEGSDWNSLL